MKIIERIFPIFSKKMIFLYTMGALDVTLVYDMGALGVTLDVWYTTRETFWG